MIQVVSVSHYNYLLFLLSRLLTFFSDSSVCFTGSSLPVGFLLHTAGLSLYFKKKNFFLKEKTVTNLMGDLQKTI